MDGLGWCTPGRRTSWLIAGALGLILSATTLFMAGAPVARAVMKALLASEAPPSGDHTNTTIPVGALAVPTPAVHADIIGLSAQQFGAALAQLVREWHASSAHGEGGSLGNAAFRGLASGFAPATIGGAGDLSRSYHAGASAGFGARPTFALSMEPGAFALGGMPRAGRPASRSDGAPSLPIDAPDDAAGPLIASATDPFPNSLPGESDLPPQHEDPTRPSDGPNPTGPTAEVWPHAFAILPAQVVSAASTASLLALGLVCLGFGRSMRLRGVVRR